MSISKAQVAAMNAAIIDITAGMVKVGEKARKDSKPYKVRFRDEVAVHLPRTPEGRLDETTDQFKAVRTIHKKHYMEAQSEADWYNAEFVKMTNGEGIKVWKNVDDIEGTPADDLPRFTVTAKLALSGGKFEKSIAMEIIKPTKALIETAERQAWNACKAFANPKKQPQGKREADVRFDEIETAILNILEEREEAGFEVESKAELVKRIKAVRKALSL
jgi:hypothetical protein